MSDQISELFVTLAVWAGTQGAHDLPSKPGLWEGWLDEFRVSINVHQQDLRSAEGLTVPPMHIAVNAPKYLGAVILVAPNGGIGTAGMEADVLAAANAAIAKAEALPTPAEDAA